MPAPDSPFDQEAPLRERAAHWVVRQDRGLSPAETAELEAWLAADPRHAEVFSQSSASWVRFREISAAVRRQPIEAGFTRAKRSWPVWASLAAAAAVTLALFSFRPDSPSVKVASPAPSPRVSLTPAPASRELPDGSLAQLKDGAEIAVAFSPHERRIRLLRGEAFFVVEKDADRPFLVEAEEVTVRAVGTAFAVRFESEAVDVLVTEGTVQVTPVPVPIEPDPATAPVIAPALVDAGHRALVARSAEVRSVVVSSISSAELSRALAWKDPMLELKGATLRELVSALTAQSGRAIEIGDPALESVRIGGRFPTADVDGFIRVIEEIYEVSSELRADGTLVLRRAAPARQP